MCHQIILLISFWNKVKYNSLDVSQTHYFDWYKRHDWSTSSTNSVHSGGTSAGIWRVASVAPPTQCRRVVAADAIDSSSSGFATRYCVERVQTTAEGVVGCSQSRFTCAVAGGTLNGIKAGGGERTLGWERGQNLHQATVTGGIGGAVEIEGCSGAGISAVLVVVVERLGARRAAVGVDERRRISKGCVVDSACENRSAGLGKGRDLARLPLSHTAESCLGQKTAGGDGQENSELCHMFGIPQVACVCLCGSRDFYSNSADTPGARRAASCRASCTRARARESWHSSQFTFHMPLWRWRKRATHVIRNAVKIGFQCFINFLLIHLFLSVKLHFTCV